MRRRNQGEDDDEPVESGELTHPSRSNDGKWTAFVKDDNVYVRDESGEELQLSRDGKPESSYGMSQWSPDSQSLAAFRIEPGENKDVYRIESSPSGGGRWRCIPAPMRCPATNSRFQLNLFDVAQRKQVKPETERIDFGFPQLRWNRDGRRFTYE